MSPRATDKLELLQGTLDMLILRTLRFGPAHGHSIATFIEQTTDDVLRVDHGSLYPALHRLARQGLISSRWEIPKGRSRELKTYRLTDKGRRRLRAETSRWERIARAINQVMKPATEA